MQEKFDRELILLALTKIYRYRPFAASLYTDLGKKETDPFQKKFFLSLAAGELDSCKRYQVYFYKLKFRVPKQQVGFYLFILRRLLVLLGPKAVLNWTFCKERDYSIVYDLFWELIDKKSD